VAATPANDRLRQQLRPNVRSAKILEEAVKLHNVRVGRGSCSHSPHHGGWRGSGSAV